MTFFKKAMKNACKHIAIIFLTADIRGLKQSVVFVFQFVLLCFFFFFSFLSFSCWESKIRSNFLQLIKCTSLWPFFSIGHDFECDTLEVAVIVISLLTANFPPNGCYAMLLLKSRSKKKRERKREKRKNNANLVITEYWVSHIHHIFVNWTKIILHRCMQTDVPILVVIMVTRF